MTENNEPTGPWSKVKFEFICTAAFRESISKFAYGLGMSDSNLVRIAVAGFIGYDLASDPKKPHGNRKYFTYEDREAAQKEQAKKRRERNAAILKRYREVQRKEGK